MRTIAKRFGIGIGLSLLFLFASIPPSIFGAVVTSTSLQSTTTPQKTNYSPTGQEGKALQDLGPASWQTNLNGFVWNASKLSSIQLSIPSVGGVQLTATSILFNSSLTSFQFTNLNLFFRPNAYQTTITIQGSSISPEQICFNLVTTGGSIFHNATETVASLGNLKFDWSDIPQSDNPLFSNSQLCFTVSGTFLIDPIALDGDGFTHHDSQADCTPAGLTTSSSPDVIVFLVNTDGGAGGYVTVSSFTTTGGSGTIGSWTKQGQVEATGGDGHFRNDEIWYTTSSTTLTTLDVKVTISSAAWVNCEIFGVSGANTGGTFWDPNGALPASGIGSGNWPSISTSNANDFIFSFGATSPTGTAGTGFTILQNLNGQAYNSEYGVFSSTQSGLSGSFSGATNFLTLADAICASGSCGASTVTQAIKISTLTAGAPSGTITITGCSPGNSTFTANGNIKHYTLTASCTVTLTTSGTSGNTRYKWNVSPKPTISATLTFATCSSGTCSQYTNSTYYQLQNTYQVTPVGPTIWGAAYAVSASGTFLGTANNLQSIGTTTSTGGAISASLWYDYNLQVALPSAIGSFTPFPIGSNLFTQTTGGNTDNTNYAITSSGGSGLNLDWLILLPVIVLMLLVALKRR